jgi:hypothetical protein
MVGLNKTLIYVTFSTLVIHICICSESSVSQYDKSSKVHKLETIYLAKHVKEMVMNHHFLPVKPENCLKLRISEPFRLRGGDGRGNVVNLMPFKITEPPPGYDDLFPCPEGDDAMISAEDALLAGNTQLARHFHQVAANKYADAFATSKNLEKLRSLEQRIGQ